MCLILLHVLLLGWYNGPATIIVSKLTSQVVVFFLKKNLEFWTVKCRDDLGFL